MGMSTGIYVLDNCRERSESNVDDGWMVCGLDCVDFFFSLN